MSDRHYLKEFEKKKEIGHPEYVSYIFALSQLDNSHKEFKKALRGYCKFFTEIKSLPDQQKLEISVGKAWHGGFHYAWKNIEELYKAKQVEIKQAGIQKEEQEHLN